MFVKKKSDIGTKMSELIKDLEMITYVKVKYICCDNAGENALIKTNLRDSGIKSKIENTSPYTPQQNGMIECSFSYLYVNFRATLNSTDLQVFSRSMLWV